jgi:hypothetical protein
MCTVHRCGGTLRLTATASLLLAALLSASALLAQDAQPTLPMVLPPSAGQSAPARQNHPVAAQLRNAKANSRLMVEDQHD